MGVGSGGWGSSSSWEVLVGYWSVIYPTIVVVGVVVVVSGVVIYNYSCCSHTQYSKSILVVILIENILGFGNSKKCTLVYKVISIFTVYYLQLYTIFTITNV